MSRKNKPSQRRIDANRLNALKSTGPRTAEGKTKSSQNAATHGLSGHAPTAIPTNPLAKGCFLHSEDEVQFQLLLGEYLATYQPQQRDEYDLLTDAVYAKWRQQRVWLAQTAQIELAIARNETALQKNSRGPTRLRTWPTASRTPKTSPASTSATRPNSIANTCAPSKNSETCRPRAAPNPIRQTNPLSSPQPANQRNPLHPPTHRPQTKPRR